ncbi:AAA family ATPase [Streptomyces fradiae]|uniref:AAA family ATPase n=1 Tax=Streptomyces fradiae TaxID=1906 RepID=UPI0033EBB771
MTRPSRTSFVTQQATGQEPPPDSPLTTKEGWRRFVGHEPSPPPPLTAAQRRPVREGEAARRRSTPEPSRRSAAGEHPDHPEGHRHLPLLVQLNRQQTSARRGVIISGASGTGKTTALSQLGRAHEIAVRRRHPRDRSRLPVLYATVPPAATPKMLAMEFARFFGLETVPVDYAAERSQALTAPEKPRSRRRRRIA